MLSVDDGNKNINPLQALVNEDKRNGYFKWGKRKNNRSFYRIKAN